MPTTTPLTKEEIDRACDRDRERHQQDDATWLCGLLYEQAARGDRRARRMIVRLRGLLVREWGGEMPPASWPPIWSPAREDEARALVEDES